MYMTTEPDNTPIIEDESSEIIKNKGGRPKKLEPIAEAVELMIAFMLKPNKKGTFGAWFFPHYLDADRKVQKEYVLGSDNEMQVRYISLKEFSKFAIIEGSRYNHYNEFNYYIIDKNHQSITLEFPIINNKDGVPHTAESLYSDIQERYFA